MAEESQSIFGKVVAGAFAIAGLVAIKVLFFGAHHVDDVSRRLTRPAERAISTTDEVFRGVNRRAQGPLDELGSAGSASSDDVSGGWLKNERVKAPPRASESEAPKATDIAGEFATDIAEEKLKSSFQNADDEDNSTMQSTAKRRVPSPP